MIESVNDASKAIAKSLELIKSFNIHDRFEELDQAVLILEEALTKLTDKM